MSGKNACYTSFIYGNRVISIFSQKPGIELCGKHFFVWTCIKSIFVLVKSTRVSIKTNFILGIASLINNFRNEKSLASNLVLLCIDNLFSFTQTNLSSCCKKFHEALFLETKIRLKNVYEKIN